MKYLDEYRDAAAAEKLRRAIEHHDYARMDAYGSLRRTDTFDR